MSTLETRALPLRAVGVHLAATVALLAATLPGLDDAGNAGQVLLGVAVLLASALALSADEPAAELLDSTPTSYARRTGRRLAPVALAAAPLWCLAHAVVALRGADVAVVMTTLQLAALAALALAVATGLRRWRRVVEPGLVGGPVLLGFLIAADQLPRSLVLLAGQPWGPPWEVAHLRWTAVLLAAASVLLIGLSDPATARLRLPGRRRR